MTISLWSCQRCLDHLRPGWRGDSHATFELRTLNCGLAQSLYHNPQSEERIDMPNIAAMLKQEITRLARKEVKAQTEAIRKANAQYRRDVAHLKRVVNL